ncbi:hypothetical protein L3i23_01040 [Herbiconiux sp. L3-i23]|nr:hypothetical protein L3i23_01040 [Herbiconiux sp. L3-i23]
MAGLFVIGTDGYTVIRYLVSILALIVAVMAVQSARWPWSIPVVVIAIVWNPVFVVPLEGTVFAALHIVAAAVFLATGLLLRAPIEPAPRRR